MPHTPSKWSRSSKFWLCLTIVFGIVGIVLVGIGAQGAAHPPGPSSITLCKSFCFEDGTLQCCGGYETSHFSGGVSSSSIAELAFGGALILAAAGILVVIWTLQRMHTSDDVGKQ